MISVAIGTKCYHSSFGQKFVGGGQSGSFPEFILVETLYVRN